MSISSICSLSSNIAVTLLCCVICSASNHLYIGCYTNFIGKSTYLEADSVSQCLMHCRSIAPVLVALKGGSSCYCGNITDTRVPSSNCNLTCADKNGTCGGVNFFAVYTDIPQYQGCMDQIFGTRYVETEKLFDKTPIDACYDKCLSLNFKFSGVPARDGAFIHCVCVDKYWSQKGIPDSQCKFCYERETFQCARIMNVYSVGHLHSLNKSYSEVFHCLRGAIDMNGTCNSTKCKYGWKGAKCNQRDCGIYNGECDHKCEDINIGNHKCDHKCEDINIGNHNISECICKEGFRSISLYHECKDIDECQSNPCNEPSETCINTIGSFMCICSPGYNYSYLSDCGATCSEKLYTCENPSSCESLSNHTCSLEIKNVHENCGRTTALILGVFLALCMSALIAVVGMVFCRKKLKDTAPRPDKLRKAIPEKGEKSITHSVSNQDHEEDKYETLRISRIYEN